jgi:signal peptidase I
MKTKNFNYQQLFFLMVIGGFLFMTGSCKKSSNPVISTGVVKVANPVSPGNVGGTIKGTFLANSTYYITSDVVVNKGDTITFQPGAKIYIKGNFNFFVHGNLSSVGTKANPVYFTVQGQAKMDNPTQDPASDPAYKGLWGGILGDTTTKFMIFKYTHIEFTGGKIGTAQTFGTSNGAYAPAVQFANVNGILDIEDSWFYGCIDGGAAVEVKQGKLNIMRNVFEKCGIYGSEDVEAGNGCSGNIAYNLMMGPCTNGVKLSNGGTLPQDDVSVYNNTIVNGGFRRYDYGGAGNQGGRGGSISFEQNARGQVYNNLMVNCRIGLRIVGTGNYSGNALLIADTAHMYYGNNFNYADSVVLTNQFYPVTFLTKPQPTDIPTPSSFLPQNYILGAVYDGSSLIGKNNPQFVNYPLPINLSAGAYYTLDRLAYVSGFDFHLKATSPAIGKGITTFRIINNGIPVDPNFGVTQVTPPGVDLGCYQSNGIGLAN